MGAQDPVPDLPYVNLVSNCLMEETKTGSVKVGAVTGSFETGRKVLFLAFKGTSYLMDFINWNIEHDHAETNDHDFFIHAGAGRVIRNLYFLKKDAFISLLESAYENGVRELVFTGHSLGGMYATSAIAKAFRNLIVSLGRTRRWKSSCAQCGASRLVLRCASVMRTGRHVILVLTLLLISSPREQ